MTSDALEPGEYCRLVETYLCQKNHGHLIRIVGPAFDMVRGWAAQGVPLKIVYRGIDAFCERQEGKPGRRRPARIEFCEADILDAFDGWRRAVGVTMVAGNGSEGTADEAASAETSPRKPSLASHIERVIARLTNVRDRGGRSDPFNAQIDTIVRDLEPLVTESRSARGEARARIVERVAGWEDPLMDAALLELPGAQLASLKAEASEELAPFSVRMNPEAAGRAFEAAFHRLVREALQLPDLRYD